jgi:3-hydroxybutyrate dehydrogenase
MTSKRTRKHNYRYRFAGSYPEIKGRVALVTGGASGIGRVTCQALASTGAMVAIVDIDDEGGKSLADEIGAIFIHADLRRQEDCRSAVSKTIDEYKRIDILVNNAGVQHISPIESFPEEKWRGMIDLMLTAPFLLTKYSWPYMMRQKFGRIINISSIHGLVASPHKSAYIAAKHGLIGLTKCAALEGAIHGITVNSICPAYVRTPLVDRQVEDLARMNNLTRDEVIPQVILKEAAIKRLIEPTEVAELVLYLCSDSASSVTGSSWTIDLGWTAR